MDEGGRDPSDNYWSDDFDPKKYCPQEEKMYNLKPGALKKGQGG